ncbi:olfactory receptor 5G29-like [Pelodytes ibericus]
MSYDRYLAICNPLRYTSIMDSRLQLQLVISSWFFSCILMLMFTLLTRNLQFCGHNIIKHYFCDLGPLLELSCSDVTIIKISNFCTTIFIAIFPFVFIIYTYVSIFITIFRIPSSIGKQKAFSTCSSHLIVVSTYYGTLITIYMVPSKGQLFNINKALSLLYTVGTPFFNPILYSLRNQEIKRAFTKCVSAMINRNTNV